MSNKLTGLFSSSYKHKWLVVRMWSKPCFFVHSGTAFVASPCTWLVPITCCFYDIQDSKKSSRIRLFPEVSWMVFSRNRAGTCCCSSVFRPGKLLIPLVVRQLWLNLQTYNIFGRHIYCCFCWLSHIFLRKNRTTKPTQQGEPHERKLLLSSANAPEILSYFVVGANTKPLGASAWNLNEK